MPCSATLFLPLGSPMPVAHRTVLTQQSAASQWWLHLKVELEKLPLLARGILCASVRARFQLSRTHGMLELAASVLSQFGGQRPTRTRDYGVVFASLLL